MLSFTLMLTAAHAQTLPFDKIDAFKKDCWAQYLKKITEDPQRQKEMAESAIPYKESVMRFALYQIGDEPEGGYPLFIALHGGGGTAPEVNDSQWEHMKIYYRSSVKCGIYVATRGVTNTWNLHCVDNSYPLYDRLIENCVAFKHVNPNRVYVLGYSAGGDGVYLLARFPKAPLHLVETAFGYRLEDASLLQLAEPEVGETARTLEVPHDVFDTYPLERMADDVDDGLLHKAAPARKLASRLAAHDFLYVSEKDAGVRTLAVHHRVKRLRRKIALTLEVRHHRRKPGMRVFADERVVVYAEHRDVLRNPDPLRRQQLKEVVRTVVVGRKDGGWAL